MQARLVTTIVLYNATCYKHCALQSQCPSLLLTVFARPCRTSSLDSGYSGGNFSHSFLTRTGSSESDRKRIPAHSGRIRRAASSDSSAAQNPGMDAVSRRRVHTGVNTGKTSRTGSSDSQGSDGEASRASTRANNFTPTPSNSSSKSGNALPVTQRWSGTCRKAELMLSPVEAEFMI